MKNKEFMSIARICVKRKLTYSDAILVLKESGFSISAKTYQRVKGELERIEPDRFDQIANEFGGYALDTIDTSIAVDDEAWNIIRTTKDEWVKIQALGLIMKNCSQKATNVEINPILARIGKALGQKKHELKEKQHILQQPKGDFNDLEENKEA